MKKEILKKPSRTRLDVWLWAARFYKSRALASKAIAQGKVTISGKRCKPSRIISLGTMLQIKQNPYQKQIMVLQIDSKRTSAPVATQLYIETPESIRLNEELKENLKHTSWAPRPNTKPNSRERKLLANIKRLAKNDGNYD